MTIDVFQPREMTDRFEEIYAPTGWLKATLFSNRPPEFHSTNSIDIDKVKGDRAVATYVQEDAGSVKVDDKKFTTQTIKVPSIKEHTLTTAGQLINQRLAGDHVYSSRSPQERGTIKLAEDQNMLSDRIDRLEEKQCAEIIQNGTVTVVGEGFSTTIDFGLLATHQRTISIAADQWDASTSKPFGDMNIGHGIIKLDSGKLAATCIMGSNVATAFLENTDLDSKLNNRRIDRGEIKPSELNDQGVSFLGTINRPNINIFEYVETYDSGTADAQIPFIDPDTLILVAPNADFRQHYGPIQDLDAMEQQTTFLTRRFFKSTIKDDPSSRKLIVNSRPLMAAHQINAIYVLKPLG